MQNLEQILQQTFGLESFREGQKNIITSVLQGNDTLVFMPTGGGKSLTYQLPGVVLDGLCLIISPLISLMKDQVDSLKARGIKAEMLNSTTDMYDRQILLNDISRNDGTVQFLYVAPERLMNRDFLRVIKNINIALVAIDEAHCISEWGHDFRPSYMKMKDFLQDLRLEKTFPIIALTATATKKVRTDIIARLGLTKPRVFTKGFDRKNIAIIVREIGKKDEKLEKLRDIITKTPGSGIVYCSSRKACQEVYEYLQDKNISSGMYTGEMLANRREQSQNAFMNDEYKVIVATNAFGMGIDKKDIRFVVHFNLPGSIENYYQEVGRAGRDGKNSYGVVLASFSDTKIQEFFIQNSYPSKDTILQFYDYLYAEHKIGAGKGENIFKTYAEMTMQSGLKNDLQVGAVIRVLEKYNILRRGTSTKNESFRGRGIELLLDKLSHTQLPIDWSHQSYLEDEAYFKLEQIKKLLFFPRCRKRFILGYFSDEEDLKNLGENCGTCDFCLEKKKSGEMEDIVKISTFVLVLEAVKKYDERFGVGTFVKLFSGSEEKKILEWKLDETEYFGVLEDFSLEAVKAIIEALIMNEYLYKTDGQYPLLGISETGRIAIVRNYLLQNDNTDLQHFVHARVKQKRVFKSQKTTKSGDSGEKKVATQNQTLAYFQEGKTVEEIVELRALKRQTIENHLIQLYEKGELALLKIFALSDIKKLKIVKEVVQKNFPEGVEKLREVKEQLPEEISYFDIHLALSMMEKKDL